MFNYDFLLLTNTTSLFGKVNSTVCPHLGHWLQNGLRSLCDIAKNMQIGSIHVLSTGQQNCDLRMRQHCFKVQ